MRKLIVALAIASIALAGCSKDVKKHDVQVAEQRTTSEPAYNYLVRTCNDKQWVIRREGQLYVSFGGENEIPADPNSSTEMLCGVKQ